MTVLVRDQLVDLLRAAVAAAQADQSLPEVALPPIDLARPKVAAHGDYSSNLGLALAKSAKLAPMQIAQTIIAHLPAADFLGKAEAAAPGYINFTLAESWLAAQVTRILEEGPSWAHLTIGHGKRVQVEHGSANPTGSAHDRIGPQHRHRRYAGESVRGVRLRRAARILRERCRLEGAQVWRNGLCALRAGAGRGRTAAAKNFIPAIFSSNWARTSRANTATNTSTRRAPKPCRRLGEIGTQRVLDHVKQTCERMNIHFDRWYSERSLYDSGLFAQVYKMLEDKGLLVEKEGAIWFASQDLGEDNDAVIIRSPQIIPNPEDRPTYFASDIAYVWDKLALRGFDRAVYVWGADHHGDKPRVLAATKALGLDPARVSILLYQLITIMKDGVEQRGSKSAGNAVALHDVIDDVGSDAIRFMLLTRAIDSKIMFDLTLAKEHSDKNPVYYVQYAHARIASILRKASEVLGTVELPEVPDVQLLTHPAELALIRKMLELPVIIEQAVRDLAPHHLTYYAQDLASTFSTFYRDCKVVDAEAPALTAARLQLCRAAKSVLARTLELMGMSTPESM